MDRCHWIRHEGSKILIPGCMGVAANMGYGRSDAWVKSTYCTCPRRMRRDPPDVAEIKRELAELKTQVAVLERQLSAGTRPTA